MVRNEEVSETILPLFSLFEICFSEHPGAVIQPIEEQALRDWRTEYDKVPRLDSSFAVVRYGEELPPRFAAC